MGGHRLSDGNPFADYDNDADCVDAIRLSLDLGQNHIDTAQFYGAGHTEEIVGQAIAGRDRDDLFIATKVWRSHSLRSAVPKAAEESCRRLGLSRIDLLYVHAPWDAIAMEEYIAGLCDAVDAGLAEQIGVSNFTADQLEKALSLTRYPIAANQVLFNLSDRGPVNAELRRLLEQHGIALVAYTPVGRSALGDLERAPKALRRIAREHEQPPSAVALAWALARGAVPIPKARRPEHIRENIRAVDIELSEHELSELDRLAEGG
jgi:diketogulonate reductase-like aldo/keto reductase